MKKESWRYGASQTERERDGAAGPLRRWLSDSPSLAPLLLNMQSHSINPHAAQLFPLNAAVLKISLAVTRYTTTLIKLPHFQVLDSTGYILQISGVQPTVVVSRVSHREGNDGIS